MFNKKLITIGLALLLSQTLTAVAATDSVVEQLVPVNANQPGPVLPIQHWTTSNGANVYFVPEHQLPILDIEILFNAGSAQDGSNFGVANFTNTMLGQGAQDLTADQIADRFDSLGAQFDTNCGRDAAQVSLRTLTDPQILDAALKTFTQVLTQPSFGTNEFNRVKNQLLQALLQEQQTPSDIADDAFYNAIYGKYPYAHQPLGNMSSVKRLTPNSLISFYRKYYVGANATISIVGDITQDQATTIANQVIGGLPVGTSAAPLPAPSYAPKQQTINIPYPSTQTYIRIGELGISRGDPNYFPLYVGNYILGGGELVSRLFQAVRDERGLTYNIVSYFIPMQQRGPFITSLQSRNSKGSEAIQVTQDVIQRFINQGPTDQELNAAKENIIGGFPLLLNSNANIVDLVAILGFYKLPLNYLDTYRASVAAVTREQVQKTFSQQLTPNNMVTVTVGPANDKPS
ncbi:MAG: M16 family metallopeptidase [Gammaproteobacteria bacterium]